MQLAVDAGAETETETYAMIAVARAEGIVHQDRRHDTEVVDDGGTRVAAPFPSMIVDGNDPAG
jgi:hypothetical protein